MAINIFEPRYRLMVRRCMEGNRCFGMASVSHGHTLCDVACNAEIVTCQPLPDGCVAVSVTRRQAQVQASGLGGYEPAPMWAAKLLGFTMRM